MKHEYFTPAIVATCSKLEWPMLSPHWQRKFIRLIKAVKNRDDAIKGAVLVAAMKPEVKA